MKRILIGLLATIILLSGCSNSSQKPTAQENAQLTILTDVQPEEPIITEPPRVPGSDALWIPILVYHRINYAAQDAGEYTKMYTIEPEWFDKHLSYLKEKGFTIIHFSDITNYFEKETPLPARPVLINFDDGYKDTYTHALPILKKHNATATLFMVSNYIGYGAFVNLDQLKELRDYGIEIGAHSISHPSLTKVDNAREEIAGSKRILEEKLGIKITAFAYPNGAVNDKVVQLTKEAGLKIGRTFANGKGISKDKLFRLPVVQITENTGLEKWEDYLYPEGQP